MKQYLILFIIIIAQMTRAPVAANQYIGDCHYYDDLVGKCNLTLICVSTQQMHSKTLLDANIKSICRNQHLYRRYTDGFSKYWIGRINFQDCDHLAIPASLFAVYDRLHTLDMSNMSIDSLNSINLTSARLTKLIASHNRIAAIPANLFQSSKLTHVDLSHNQIRKIDSLALPVNNRVEVLDVSFNNLTDFDVNTFQQFGELNEFYVSNNQIREIPSFLFHKVRYQFILRHSSFVIHLHSMTFFFCCSIIHFRRKNWPSSIFPSIASNASITSPFPVILDCKI